MKYHGQISTGQYEFIAWEREGTAQEAVETHRELLLEWKQDKSFASIVTEYVTTGGIVNGGNITFSEKEREALKHIKKLLKTK